jgi:hypothetical protein
MQTNPVIANFNGQMPFISPEASFTLPLRSGPLSPSPSRIEAVKAKVRAQIAKTKKVGNPQSVFLKRTSNPSQAVDSVPFVSAQEREADFKRGIANFQQSCPDFFKPLNLV